MKPIKIVCLNPALDHNIDVTEFALGGVMRARSANLMASGKGINSALAIAAIGYSSTLYSIVGKHDVDMFRQIDPLITTELGFFEGRTRVNVTVTERSRELICHLQTAGPETHTDTIQELIAIAVAGAESGDVFVISGSLPTGADGKAIASFLNALAEKGAQIVLDIDPRHWFDINLEKIHWIKPNLEEWSRFRGTHMKNLAEASHVGVGSNAPMRVVLSGGAEGALLMSAAKPPFIHGWTELKEQAGGNPTGCGDAMVAGIAVALAKEKSEVDVLRYGISMGYANLFATGPGRISRVKFDFAFQRFRNSIQTPIQP